MNSRGKTLAENENAIKQYWEMWEMEKTGIKTGSLMERYRRATAGTNRNANSMNQTIKNIEHILREEGVIDTLGTLRKGVVPRANGQRLLKAQVFAHLEGCRLVPIGK
jgi:hypothetical protein